MSVRVTLLPPEPATKRKSYLADLIVLFVQAQHGPIPFQRAVHRVAMDERIAVSEVKHGLNRALAHGRLTLDGDDALRIP